MIVTIDGPAGAGKSSVARELARRLGFAFLDTGSMYRAVALAALRAGLGESDGEKIAELAERVTIDVGEDRVLLSGDDVTQAIRTSEVSAAVHLAADNVFGCPRKRVAVTVRLRPVGATARQAVTRFLAKLEELGRTNEAADVRRQDSSVAAVQGWPVGSW